MGEVYLCLDLEEGLPFALKIFQHRYLGGARLQAAFEQEVATWIALEKHPNIVRCMAMVVLDNQPFMVLEWIASEEGRGIDLRSWLRHGPLDVWMALDFIIDICRGMLQAQQKQPGSVHQDLKPENILVAQGRLAKITDFGLAKIVRKAELGVSNIKSSENDRQSLIGRGNVIGTPPYMAPEQWDGQTIDTRTDIYTSGCILYELLTSNWPYRATTLNELRRQHREAKLLMLLKENDLFVALNPLIACCLAKRPEDRVPTVHTLLQNLTSLYHQCIGESPKSPPALDEFTAASYSNRDLTYDNLQRYDEALNDYNLAIGLDPQLAQAYSNRGTTYINLQRYDDALRDYSQAIALAPELAQLYSNRGVTYTALQRYDDALKDYSQAIELDYQLAEAYCNRGLVYAALKDYDNALSDYNRAIEFDPRYATAYANRALTYHNLQQYNEALRDYTLSIELAPQFVEAYANRGISYCTLQCYDEALHDFNQAIELAPQLAEAYSNRGLVYHNLQRYNEALRNFDQAIELDPHLAEAYYNRGSTYYALQCYDEALCDYTQTTELNPQDTKAYVGSGVIFVNLGRLHDALTYFERAAELGDSTGAVYAEHVRQKLVIKAVSQEELFQHAAEAFQLMQSLMDMQTIVTQFPFMTGASFINEVEQAIRQQIQPGKQPEFLQRLGWLRQIANTQQEKENIQ